jgi:hypothetical protein
MRTLIPLFLIFLMVGALGAQDFRTPVEVTALTASPTPSDFAPTLTGDALTIYWHSSRTGGAGSGDIWMSTRTSLTAPWSTPVNVKELNTTNNEYYVTVRFDNLEIIFARDMGSPNYTELYSATRKKVTDPWGTPKALTTLNTTNYEDDPNIRGDGLELFFSSNRSGQSQATGLWHATRKDLNSPWSAPVLIKEIDNTQDDHSPAISGDGLTLFWSIYNYPGGTGSSDFFKTTRPDVNSPFSTKFVEMKEINSTLWDHNGCQTFDGFSFYYTRNQENKIYRADRILCVVSPLASMQNPVRGKLFPVYVRRDPGDSTGVIAGALYLLPGPVSIPGVQGQLMLNLGGGSLVWLHVGLLSTQGTSTTQIPVPDHPALAGVKVHFQGGVQDKGNKISISPLRTVTVQ